MTREITSNKVVLIIQALAIVTAAAPAAVALESSGILQTSVLGRASAFTGFTIHLGDTSLEIVERLGRSQIAYANILELKLIPAYGVGTL